LVVERAAGDQRAQERADPSKGGVRAEGLHRLARAMGECHLRLDVESPQEGVKLGRHRQAERRLRA
jgi:hypothetical protein